MENTSDSSLLKENNYYKQQLDELSQAIIKLQYQNIQASHVASQMRAGLRLIAGLKEVVSTNITFNQLYDRITELILNQLHMDKVLVLLNHNNQKLTPCYLKGYNSEAKAIVESRQIEMPSTLINLQNSFVATSGSEENDLIAMLRSQLMITYFIFTPVLIGDVPFAFILASRKNETNSSSSLRLMQHDQDIMEAISGLISTLKIQIDQNIILEQKVTLRTEQLNLEKKKSDDLLLNILPEEIAEELKANGKAEAQHINEATVLFSDFSGFTEISEKLSPNELVAEINVCFSAFDRISEKLNIEKIKTIGDAYMAVGGLPVPTNESVKYTVLAALEMQAFIEARKNTQEAEGHPAFEMRVGIHTGPVVAGIVGVKKFQYDIWGDTVNTASRMESAGEVGKVNISPTTYELLKNDPCFAFESRGKIEAKGKGEMEMWFVYLKD